MNLRIAFFILIYCSLLQLFAQGEYIVELDLTTNSFTKIGAKIDDVTFIIPGYNTYDRNGSIFYFISAQEKFAIYGIDTKSGDEVFSMPIENFTAIEYSNSLDKLFAIKTDVTNNTKYLVHINTSSQEVTQVGGVLEAASMFQGYDAFNDKDNVYTFTGPPNILYSIDAVSGQTIHEPQISLPAGQAIQHYDYHPTTGLLYTLISEGDGAQVFLAKINIENASIEKIGDGIGDLGNGGSAAINENTNSYNYLHVFAGSHWHTSLSLETGEIIHNKEINTAALDNLVDLEYDNVQDKYFAKHWDAMSTTSVIESIHSNINIYPNPAQNQIVIESNESGKKINAVSLLDISGKKIKDLYTGIGNPILKLNLNIETPGVYLLKIKLGTKSLIERIVVK